MDVAANYRNGVKGLISLFRKKASPHNNNKKKSWNDAMRLYNIRNGELEVVIQRGETSTITTRPRASWKTQEIKADYAPPIITEDKKANSSSWSAWSARVLLVSGGIAAMGNIPV